jgi:hypothetical protein
MTPSQSRGTWFELKSIVKFSDGSPFKNFLKMKQN